LRRRDRHRDGRRARRAGFTLLEVLVALGLATLVVVSARALLDGLGDAAARIALAARAGDADANAERLLRALASRIEVGTLEAGSFGGTDRAAEFTSWCETPSGWQERCRVNLRVEARDGRPALVTRLSTGEVITIRGASSESVGASLRYLTDPAAGGVWIREWGTGLAAPVAIGVLLGPDTLIVRVGERG
jgi:prepilin-type N-terminal cleavage/methylation domain-containing protein